MSSGNFLFLMVLILGPIISISSSNWIICWVGLELSFMGAIPLLLADSSFISLSKESVMKYFCVQAMGSGLLMLGGILFYMSPGTSNLSELVFILALFMKLGVFPLHFWVPSVTAGLNWTPMFILLAWQKIPPFALLANILENTQWMKTPILLFGGLSALAGALIGLNQTSTRAMLGSSSIAHTGWACVGATFGNLWAYFFIYCLSFALLMIFCMMNEEFMMSMGILSLSGLPPFVMFIGKWSILKSAFCSNVFFMALVLPILGALLSLFFYLKFFYSFYLSSSSDSTNKKYLALPSLAFISLSGVVFILFF
uniref:NADH-ubiquinone oxidoreductase chain 2 n=1 Tax=Homoiodoris japonica TaxID=1663358 RepID=A0A1R7SVB0_9GAST|nr:NADH dehydrogenase subunit 2 [Homoiodoris japonica]AKK32251.1 NADH dehydrogenase subunit 2 [Homoiodoris japonica]